MKNLQLLSIALFISSMLFAQNNLFEELAKYEGQEFKAYDVGINRDVEGKHKFEEREGWLKVEVIKDAYGKGIGVTMKTGEGGQDYLTFTYDPKYDRIDHYKEPAFSRSSEYNKGALLMIDGVLMTFTYTNKNLSKYDKSYVYVPRSIIETQKEESSSSKKGKFKSFMKSVGSEIVGKSITKTPSYLKFIETKDLFNAAVSNYLSEMRKKQATPLTAEEEKRWQEVIDMKKKAEEELAEYNRKFYASEAGQAQLKIYEENKKRSGSGSSSSSSSSGTAAKVQVKYHNIGNNRMYVYYTKPDGSKGKGSITKGSSAWFTVSAGSSLYYSLDDNGNEANKQFLVTSKTTGNAYVEK